MNNFIPQILLNMCISHIIPEGKGYKHFSDCLSQELHRDGGTWKSKWGELQYVHEEKEVNEEAYPAGHQHSVANSKNNTIATTVKKIIIKIKSWRS